MSEKPILFSTEMIHALLEGRKTQTRRLVKPHVDGKTICAGYINKRPCAGPFPKLALQKTDAQRNKLLPKFKWCPYGKPGDLLWVRESFQHIYPHDQSTGWTIYKASPEYADQLTEIKWKPSIHMPKAIARIWLQVEKTEIHRLNDITPADAECEGVENFRGSPYGFLCYWIDPNTPILSTADTAFKYLWESIHGKGSWNANPYVWAVHFKVLSTTGKPETWPGKQLRVDEMSNAKTPPTND